MVKRKIYALILMFALAFAFFASAAETERPVIRVGFAQGLEMNIEQNTLNPTLHYLQQRLPQYDFVLEQISPVDTLEEIRKSKLNFFFAPSNFYVEIIHDIPLTHIVTRSTLEAENPARTLGSVFFTKADRDDIKDLADLKGKSCAASLPNSLGGWLAALGEIKRNGWNPDKFFSKVSFLQFQTPDVLNAVLVGAADVGVLSTCTLENAVRSGIISQDSIKVINQKNENANSLKCVRSTEALYPDLVFVAVKGTPETIIKNVAIALLAMPDFDHYRWSIEDNYYAVRSLLEDLQLGPYAYMRDNTVPALFKRFKTEILTALGLILFLVLNELRLHWLVNRKTRELHQALKDKIAADKTLQSERKKMALLERNGVISQMSSIIAHEAKQPLGTILNYLEILRMKQEVSPEKDPIVLSAINNVAQQVGRLNSLVESVRNFAKKKENPLIPSDLVEITEKAIRSFRRNEPEYDAVKVNFLNGAGKALVRSDPVSLELLIINLLRNGAHAALEAEKIQKPFIKITIRRIESSRFELKIENSGNVMTDEQMARLISLGESVKAEGLGLGLSIIRSIADHHSADLGFRKRKGGGVAALLEIDQLEIET